MTSRSWKFAAITGVFLSAGAGGLALAEDRPSPPDAAKHVMADFAKANNPADADDKPGTTEVTESTEVTDTPATTDGAGNGATPAVPATPAIPATPGGPDGPAVPATPAIPATPAVPANGGGSAPGSSASETGVEHGNGHSVG